MTGSLSGTTCGFLLFILSLGRLQTFSCRFSSDQRRPASEELGWPYGAITKLLLLTGQRQNVVTLRA
jgi:hypothetical protein